MTPAENTAQGLLRKVTVPSRAADATLVRTNILQELRDYPPHIILGMTTQEFVDQVVPEIEFGWEEYAPFDRIIVTCAATFVPPPLLKELDRGGKMCIPVGAQYTVQYLTMIEKSEAGGITMRKTLPVGFVPLTRGNGEPRQ